MLIYKSRSAAGCDLLKLDGIGLVRLAGFGFALDVAFHMGFLAGLQSHGWSLPTGDRLLAQNAHRLLASPLPH